MLSHLTLKVTTAAGGAGDATTPVRQAGYIKAIGLDFAAGAAAGTDTTITIENMSGPTRTILALTDVKTDGWYYPRELPCQTDGTAFTDVGVEIPFDGKVKVAVAQGGASVTDCVKATIYYETA